MKSFNFKDNIKQTQLSDRNGLRVETDGLTDSMSSSIKMIQQQCKANTHHRRFSSKRSPNSSKSAMISELMAQQQQLIHELQELQWDLVGRGHDLSGYHRDLLNDIQSRINAILSSSNKKIKEHKTKSKEVIYSDKDPSIDDDIVINDVINHDEAYQAERMVWVHRDDQVKKSPKYIDQSINDEQGQKDEDTMKEDWIEKEKSLKDSEYGAWASYDYYKKSPPFSAYSKVYDTYFDFLKNHRSRLSPAYAGNWKEDQRVKRKLNVLEQKYIHKNEPWSDIKLDEREQDALMAMKRNKDYDQRISTYHNNEKEEEKAGKPNENLTVNGKSIEVNEKIEFDEEVIDQVAMECLSSEKEKVSTDDEAICTVSENKSSHICASDDNEENANENELEKSESVSQKSEIIESEQNGINEIDPDMQSVSQSKHEDKSENEEQKDASASNELNEPKEEKEINEDLVNNTEILEEVLNDLDLENEIDVQSENIEQDDEIAKNWEANVDFVARGSIVIDPIYNEDEQNKEIEVAESLQPNAENEDISNVALNHAMHFIDAAVAATDQNKKNKKEKKKKKKKKKKNKGKKRGIWKRIRKSFSRKKKVSDEKQV